MEIWKSVINIKWVFVYKKANNFVRGSKVDLSPI